MEQRNIIRVGDSVLLKKGKNMKVFKIIKKQKVFLEKRHFSLDPIIGQPYGSSWELKNRDLVPVTDETESHEIAGQIVEGDNRAIVDDQMAQKLDRDDISDLKEQGKSGQEIIDHLIENSSTFNEKTVYSKAKYLKKKKNKHIMKFVVLRPSTRLLCEHFFLKSPSKHVQIRLDSLSQMLTASNIQSGSKVMVYEHCQGLLVGAVMERLGGNGMIVQFHSEDRPNHSALDAYNFPRQSQETLKLFNLKDVYSNLVAPTDSGVQNSIEDKEGTSATNDESKPTEMSILPGGSVVDRTASPSEAAVTGSEASTVTSSKEAPMVIDSTMEASVSTDSSCSRVLPGAEAEEVPMQVDSSTPTAGEQKSSSEDCPGGVKESTVSSSSGAQELGTEIKDNTSALGDGEKSIVPDSSCSSAAGEEEPSIQAAGSCPTQQEGESSKASTFSAPLSPRTLKRKQRDDGRDVRKRQRLEEFAQTKETLLERRMDSLLIATKHHPTPVLLALIDMLALSRPFAVFSPYIEALKECYVKLKDRGGIIHLNLSETWYRDYQVLPNRTHPMVNMSSSGGYVLTGILVAKE